MHYNNCFVLFSVSQVGCTDMLRMQNVKGPLQGSIILVLLWESKWTISKYPNHLKTERLKISVDQKKGPLKKRCLQQNNLMPIEMSLGLALGICWLVMRKRSIIIWVDFSLVSLFISVKIFCSFGV